MTIVYNLPILTPQYQATSIAYRADRRATHAPNNNWDYLVPVRTYCEVHGVPAQMGNEEIPNFWRLRETRAFVAWLRAREPRVVEGGALREWADARPSDPWHDLLRQAIDEHALETGGGEVPVDHVIEWLAEWGREIRRRQQGLLLVTAHGAKGLEFDHVAVLDGGWDWRDPNEDPDAPRRLYYVAMTRARQTLALARFDGPHPLQDALPDQPAVITRRLAEPPAASPELLYRHKRPGLQDVDLGFAGRKEEDHPIHRAIAALSPGDPLRARITDQGRWQLLDETGTVVGHLATSFRPPDGMRCRASTVLAVVGWSRESSEPKYRDTIKCDSWEVVVPELVFEPH